MGIKRTSDAKEAITDMAVMNMTGGFSMPDYQKLISYKNAEIEEFIYEFLPAIDEYRANYFNEEGGQAHDRAVTAHNLLNLFKDGGRDNGEKYPDKDTGKELGELLLEDLVEEGNAAGGSLRQIILESSSAIVLAIENAIAMAADTGEKTWLDRASVYTWDYLKEHVADFCEDAHGNNEPASIINSLFETQYGDVAVQMSEQWNDIHERMIWYRDYVVCR